MKNKISAAFAALCLTVSPLEAQDLKTTTWSSFGVSFKAPSDITIEDDSVSTLGSEYYVFTDDDGRFVISDLRPGRYAFDVPYDDGWILYSFAVEENEEHAVDIQLLENPEREYLTLPDVYSSMYTFDNGPYITGDDFWAMLYPMMEEAV